MNPVNSVREVTLIEVVVVVGDGTKANPVRYLRQYWTKEGELLAECDTIKE